MAGREDARSGSVGRVTVVTELELPSFDPTDPAMRGERFHTAMAEVAAQGWLALGPYGFLALDRESVEFFLRTRSATFPGLKMAEIFGVEKGPLYDQIANNLLNVNGEDHRRLRTLVNPSLSPRAVERYRPVMRDFLAALWEPVAADGRCELVGALAKPYPSQVIAHVMGAPLADADRLHHWSNMIQRQFDAVSMLEERPLIEQATIEFYAYAENLLRARREDPSDDLISALIAAEAEGDRLSDTECINLVFNVLIGGVDTSQSQLTHAIRLLAAHPEQWRLLAEDPSLAPRAVDEALRFEPITPFTARIMLEDITFRDVTFPEGTVVMVCAFTGNRDLDDGDADPDAFDITAQRAAARALTFGAGIHYCLGANLARVELAEALAFLAPRMPGLELDGEPEYESVSGIYGMARLPVRWDAAAARAA
jgi:cytochrome P450